MRNIVAIVFFIFSLSFAYANEVDPRTKRCWDRGFDCYMSRKCVNDGSKRPFARLRPGYKRAISDVLINPNHFVLYPKIFYICPQNY